MHAYNTCMDIVYMHIDMFQYICITMHVPYTYVYISTHIHTNIHPVYLQTYRYPRTRTSPNLSPKLETPKKDTCLPEKKKNSTETGGKNKQRGETAKEERLGRPVPLLWRRQKRPPEGGQGQCPYAPPERQREVKLPRPVA